MPKMFHVLRERAIGMLTAGMSKRAVARELNIHFSIVSLLQHSFGEFSSMYNQPHIRRRRVWCHVGKRFADVNIVNRVPHGGGGVMVWACISYGQLTIAFYQFQF